MSTPAVWRLLKPVLVLIQRATPHPLQPAHRLTIVQNLQVLTQTQNAVHDLPRSVILRGKHPLPLHFPRFPDQLHQRIVGVWTRPSDRQSQRFRGLFCQIGTRLGIPGATFTNGLVSQHRSRRESRSQKQRQHRQELPNLCPQGHPVHPQSPLSSLTARSLKPAAARPNDLCSVFGLLRILLH